MIIKNDKVMAYRERLLRNCHLSFKARGHVRPRDKLKTLNLFYHNDYGQETSQDGEIPQGTTTHRVILPYNNVWYEIEKTNRSSLSQNLWPLNFAEC